MSTLEVDSIVASTSGADLNLDGAGSGVVNLATGAKLNGTALTSTFQAASANIPDVAPGTSGNLLTSNGSAWTSAAAPAGGAWSYVSSISPTSAATVDFETLVAGYDYTMVLHQIEMAYDPDHLYIRVGTGGTPVYQTSGYNSIGHYNSTTTFTTSHNADVSTAIDTTRQDSFGSAAGERVDGEILILDPAAAAISMIKWDLFGQNGGGAYLRVGGFGQWSTATALTGIRLTASLGTGFNSGRVDLFRRKNS
jgi:hypothetical protein